jgi:hypothetical protein
MRKIGIEAEFLLTNDKGEFIIPPDTFDRDDYPLLGEIRGEPGDTPIEAVSNFMAKKYEVEDRLKKGHNMVFTDAVKIPLKLYKKANSLVTVPKNAAATSIYNLYGTDISMMSDQIIKNKKIQGVNVGTGLHIHFSSRYVKESIVTQHSYSRVNIPITFPGTEQKMTLDLYERVGDSVETVVKAEADQLVSAAVKYIVGEMDNSLFMMYAPPEKTRTKYRHPGFYEYKDYGFEYRSLPANETTIGNLLTIAKEAWKIMAEAIDR